MTSRKAIAIATLTAVYTTIVLLRWKKRVKKLPPGPPKIPLLDNLFNMPPNLDAELSAKIGKEKNSEIIHLGALGMDIVVLNSYRVAKELLEQRSGIYSSRPDSTMFKLSGWAFQFVAWPYGEEWRRARKLFTKWFSIPAVHEPRSEFYVQRLLKQLLDEPDKWYSHIRHLPGSATLDMTYGIKVESTNDPFVSLAEAGARDGADLFIEGPHAVDVLPILRYLPAWVPGAGFQRRAASSKALAERLTSTPFEATRKMMEAGDHHPSFVSHALEDSTDAVDTQLVKEVAGQVFLAGSDTSTAALGTFVLSMVLNPDIQRKAQLELDSVLNGRLPTLEDLQSLPYITAIVWEVQRWRPVVPSGVPHVTTLEDVFEGYHIPKGALVAPNHWAMMRDERDFPEPDQFRPERYLKDGQIDTSVRSPMDIAFGFGRRICPGRHIAQNIIALTAASVLSMFDIMKQTDAKGNVIEPTGEYEGKLISQPLEFPCQFKPRSAQAVELIESQ